MATRGTLIRTHRPGKPQDGQGEGREGWQGCGADAGPDAGPRLRGLRAAAEPSAARNGRGRAGPGAAARMRVLGGIAAELFLQGTDRTRGSLREDEPSRGKAGMGPERHQHRTWQSLGLR